MMVGDGEARAEREKNGDYPDPQKFLGRDRAGFLQSSDRDYRERGEGFHLDHRLHKDTGGDADDRKSIYGVNQLTGFGFGRDQDRGGRDRGLGPEADYRDMGVIRSEVSEVSHSEGTEDEEDGDMDGGQGHAIGREIVIAERGIPRFEGRIRQDSMIPSRAVDGYQRPASDRDRGMKPRPASSSSSYGIFPPPSQEVVGLNFLKYPAASPSGGQMGSHVDSNSAQNGGVGGAGGAGSGIPGSYGGGGDGGGGISRDAYAKSLVRENASSASLHEQPSQGLHIHEGLHASEENCYSSLVNSSGRSSMSQKDLDLGADGASPSMKRSARMMESPSLRSILRSILSDPVSGQLMEDATIFACGHTFGNLGLRQVLASSICISCGASVRSTSMAPAPNHALRAAVQALKRDEENFAVLPMRQEENFVGSRREEDNFTTPKTSKKRRDRTEQSGSRSVDHQPSEGGRAKGVQFPYSVSERVLIKGNKRTPERFVGREAVITNQCLNGWYLVKTLDNGESVRLQYRSLQKLGGAQPSQNPVVHS